VTSIGWLGTRRAYAVAYTTPLTSMLLADVPAGVDAGFGFFDNDGRLIASVVSEHPISTDKTTLRNLLSSSAARSTGSFTLARYGGVALSATRVGGTEFRLVTRRAIRPNDPADSADGFIVGAVSLAASQETTKMSTNLIVVWSTIAVVALVALGFWVARRVSDPLVELADGARRIADGDFSAKVHVPGDNELAVLADTFNDMTDSLRERSEALTKKVLELAMLYEMSRALGSTLDMDDLLGSTLDSALRIFDLDVGYVALRDRESGLLEIRAVRGGDAGDAKGAEAVRSSMAEWVVREGRPLIFNPDPASTEGHIDALTGAKAALCVPLVSAEGTIGAITVGSSNAEYRFNSDDVRLLSTIGNHVTIAIGNIELFSSLQEAYLATVRSLAAAVDAKDTYTRGHSDKVATYATFIATRMGLSHDQLTALEMAAYLHDIGKIGVPEEILLKPGRLTDDEMVQMRHHPLIGANILKPVAFPWAITPIVRHHHEYWDGKGYPAGLKGEEIPLLARILCVADSYEAMTADRPYRKGRTAAEAVEELNRCAGTQFDPAVVEHMEAVIEDLQRTGEGVLGEPAGDVSAEEARAIFGALVDGVLSSFRRLGGPRLASNVESDVDEYFRRQRVPYRMADGRVLFEAETSADLEKELGAMRASLRHIDALIARVSGGTLVQHFYDDALENFSSRMRYLAAVLEFYVEE
jgi:putative nucleotidyltransferase with HDIG domain